MTRNNLQQDQSIMSKPKNYKEYKRQRSINKSRNFLDDSAMSLMTVSKMAYPNSKSKMDTTQKKPSDIMSVAQDQSILTRRNPNLVSNIKRHVPDEPSVLSQSIISSRVPVLNTALDRKRKLVSQVDNFAKEKDSIGPNDSELRPITRK